MSVYFIKVGRYFKIGYSDNAVRRFENLHKGGTRYTFPVDAPTALAERLLYKVIPGEKWNERAIHLALDNFNVGLEWFLDEPPLREFIDSLSVTLDPPLTIARVPRAGGWCEREYRDVQQGRGERETARYFNRRRRSA